MLPKSEASGCKNSYAEELAKICEANGGGAGPPIIKTVDASANRITANVKLGEELKSAIDGIVILPSDLCVRTGAALLGTNLTSPKAGDGVARMHTKADVQNLKTKGNRGRALEI